MYVCMYVCMYSMYVHVCMHACMCVYCMYVCMGVCRYIYVYIVCMCVCVCMYVHMYVCMCMYIVCTWCTYKSCMCVCIYIYIYIQCMYVCTLYVYVCVCVYIVCMCVCMYVCMYVQYRTTEHNTKCYTVETAQLCTYVLHVYCTCVKAIGVTFPNMCYVHVYFMWELFYQSLPLQCTCEIQYRASHWYHGHAVVVQGVGKLMHHHCSRGFKSRWSLRFFSGLILRSLSLLWLMLHTIWCYIQSAEDLKQDTWSML